MINKPKPQILQALPFCAECESALACVRSVPDKSKRCIRCYRKISAKDRLDYLAIYNASYRLDSRGLSLRYACDLLGFELREDRQNRLAVNGRKVYQPLCIIRGIDDKTWHTADDFWEMFRNMRLLRKQK